MSNLFAKREKKELSPSQQKAKTIIGWVVSAICIVIIIAALAISVLTITRTTSDNGVAHLGKHTFNSVVTDSMEPTIAKGELIIAKVYNDETDRGSLQVGQTIVYKKLMYNSAAGGNVEVFFVHRIDSLGAASCHVIGDNPNTAEQDDNVSYNNIIATWGSPATLNEDGTFTVTKDSKGASLGKLGTFVNWLQEDRTNYFCVIVLPLILLFVIYGFVLIRALVIAKLSKDNEKKSVSVEDLSEDEKKRLAAELLASLTEKKETEQIDSDSQPSSENADSCDAFVSAENGEIQSSDTADVSDTIGEEGGQQ